MDLLGFITLVVTGFTACAEFGSYAFVHPVIRRLPPEHHIRVEQGLLGTFGRVMPILMTLSVVLSVAYAVHSADVHSTIRVVRWTSAVSFVLSLASTIAFNVPINLATVAGTPSSRLRTGNAQEIAGNFCRVFVLAPPHRLPLAVSGS
jgi:uncharacterized BrkB/YihY/UPF0761 family membrane protein